MTMPEQPRITLVLTVSQPPGMSREWVRSTVSDVLSRTGFQFTAVELAATWPPPGTAPTHEDNRGTTEDGRRYKYSGPHNGFIMLDEPAGALRTGTPVMPGPDFRTWPIEDLLVLARAAGMLWQECPDVHDVLSSHQRQLLDRAAAGYLVAEPPAVPVQIRQHQGFSHGLAPGQDHDMNCLSCQREQAEDILVPGEAGEDDGSDHDESRYAASLLPAGAMMNPAQPEKALYYDIDQVAYVVTNSTGQVRVLTSFGALPGWDTGTKHEIRHDQTWYPLGRWTVTGIRDYSAGEPVAPLGTIPDRPLRHWIFK